GALMTPHASRLGCCLPGARRPSMKHAMLILVLVPFLGACGKHYWSRPGASFSDFAKDSQECAQATAIITSPSKDYGIVRPDYYRACLKGHGWVRAQHPEPVPVGWYRGFEDDDVVKLDSLPRQPEVEVPSSWSSLPPCERGGGATARDSQ